LKFPKLLHLKQNKYTFRYWKKRNRRFWQCEWKKCKQHVCPYQRLKWIRIWSIKAKFIKFEIFFLTNYISIQSQSQSLVWYGQNRSNYLSYNINLLIKITKCDKWANPSRRYTTFNCYFQLLLVWNWSCKKEHYVYVYMCMYKSIGQQEDEQTENDAFITQQTISL